MGLTPTPRRSCRVKGYVSYNGILREKLKQELRRLFVSVAAHPASERTQVLAVGMWSWVAVGSNRCLGTAEV